jgi:hypothetical protein
MKRHVTVGAVVLGLALSSCGGDDKEATTGTAPPAGAEAPSQGTTPQSEPHLPPFALPPEFRTCMAGQGVEISDSGELPSGIDSAQFQQAMQACAQFLHAN